MRYASQLQPAAFNLKQQQLQHRQQEPTHKLDIHGGRSFAPGFGQKTRSKKFYLNWNKAWQVSLTSQARFCCFFIFLPCQITSDMAPN